MDSLLCLWLFGELTVTWNAMSYLTAIKDYRGIMLSFTAAIVITFISGWVLLMLGIPHVEALLIAVAVGYGVMLLWDVILFVSVFSPRGKGCLPFPKMGGSVSASGIYRAFYQYWTVCPFGDHVGRTASGTGAGTVCWCTLP